MDYYIKNQNNDIKAALKSLGIEQKTLAKLYADKYNPAFTPQALSRKLSNNLTVTELINLLDLINCDLIIKIRD